MLSNQDALTFATETLFILKKAKVMNKQKIKQLVLSSFLLLSIFQLQARGCFVYSASQGKWHYFSSLCCHHFFLDLPLGDMCFNYPNTSCGALQDGDGTVEMVAYPGPSLSSLTEICDYRLSIHPDGSGTIYLGDAKVATLTSDGLKEFFSEKPCFYQSNEVEMTVIGGELVVGEKREKIMSTRLEEGPRYGLPLGQLTEEQVNMIKTLCSAPAQSILDAYALRVSPNPGHEMAKIEFQVEKAGDAVVSLVNVYGSRVTRDSFVANAGLNTRIIALQQLTPGTYFVLLEHNGITLSEKLIRD